MAYDSPVAAGRIAILVLGCRQPLYQRCIETIRATWGRAASERTDIFYVYGARSSGHEPLVDVERLGALHEVAPPRHELGVGELWSAGELILCGTADVLADQRDCILRKRLLAFEHLANTCGYDFVFNVCASSYVEIARLERYVAGIPGQGVYHGPLIVHEASGFPFVSGACFLISRDLAADLADCAEHMLSDYPDSLPDDVVLGHRIASRHGGDAVAEIAGRIAAGQRATANQTFVVPDGGVSLDFVTKPEFRQVPDAQSFHFHFHSARMWEMENFHRRFFAPDARDGGA